MTPQEINRRFSKVSERLLKDNLSKAEMQDVERELEILSVEKKNSFTHLPKRRRRMRLARLNW